MKANQKAIEVRDPEALARGMTNEALAARVKVCFQKIADELPYIMELRRRFEQRRRVGVHHPSDKICGCATWQEFCEKVLHRTDRAIRKAIFNEQVRTGTKFRLPKPATKETNVVVHVEPVTKPKTTFVQVQIERDNKVLTDVANIQRVPNPFRTTSGSTKDAPEPAHRIHRMVRVGNTVHTDTGHIFQDEVLGVEEASRRCLAWIVSVSKSVADEDVPKLYDDLISKLGSERDFFLDKKAKQAARP